MKNSFGIIVLTLIAPVLSFSQTPTPLADETLRLCVASMQTKQFEAAVTDCGKMIAKFPARFEGYQARGIAHFQLKNFSAATADFTKAIELAPKNPQLFGLRGELYASIGKEDLAIADYNKVLQLVPNSPVALYRRARAYLQLEMKDEAIADLKAILAADPKQAEAKNLLALLEPTSVKSEVYRNDKYKVAFQIPANSSKGDSYLAEIKFVGDKSKFGNDATVELKVFNEGFLRLHPGNTETDSKSLATEKGLKGFANTYKLERFLDNQSRYPFFEDLETKLVSIGGLNALKVHYAIVPDPEKIFSKRMSAVFIIPVPAHKRYYQLEITAAEEFFAKWFANAETAVNTFEILKP